VSLFVSRLDHFSSDIGLSTFSIGQAFNGIPDASNFSNRAVSAEGNCEDKNRNVVCTYMWLNRCYDNDYKGNLVPVSDGTGIFANTCDNCRANNPLRVGWLFCDCYKSTPGGVIKVRVETNMRKLAPSEKICAVRFGSRTFG